MGPEVDVVANALGSNTAERVDLSKAAGLQAAQDALDKVWLAALNADESVIGIFR